MRFVLARCLAVAAALAALAPAPGLADDPVVANLNGSEIRQSDVLRARGRLPASLRNKPLEQIVPLLTTMVIDSRLLADEAREQGIAYEPEVRAQINTVTDLVLEQELLGRVLDRQLTPEAVRARYEELAAQASSREQVRARHILVKTEEAAKQVIGELNAGADFADLARVRSTGPTADTGGDLGYFIRGEMAPAFSEAAFALEPGTYTLTPVQTDFGWHVILVEDRRLADPPPFEEVKEEVRIRLASELRTRYVETLRDKATIERFDR